MTNKRIFWLGLIASLAIMPILVVNLAMSSTPQTATPEKSAPPMLGRPSGNAAPFLPPVRVNPFSGLMTIAGEEPKKEEPKNGDKKQPDEPKEPPTPTQPQQPTATPGEGSVNPFAPKLGAAPTNQAASTVSSSTVGNEPVAASGV